MEKTKVKDSNTQEEVTHEITDKPIVYELSYIFLPSLSLEEVNKEVHSITSRIESTGGSLIADGQPVLIDLAYQMLKVVSTTRHKVSSGYFGWIKFDLPQGDIIKIKKTLDATDTLVRFLIIKTVRENTFIAGKMISKKDDLIAKEIEGQDENSGEIEGSAESSSVEEIDKSIDELVIA